MASEKKDFFIKTATPAALSALGDWLAEIEQGLVEKLLKANDDDFRKVQGKILALRDFRKEISPSTFVAGGIETTY